MARKIAKEFVGGKMVKPGAANAELPAETSVKDEELQKREDEAQAEEAKTSSKGDVDNVGKDAEGASGEEGKTPSKGAKNDGKS
jgi:hypothetical protein